jgi:hypothetical protein
LLTQLYCVVEENFSASVFSLFVVVVVVNCCGEIDLGFVAPPNCRLSAHLKKEGKKERKRKKEGRKEEE